MGFSTAIDHSRDKDLQNANLKKKNHDASATTTTTTTLPSSGADLVTKTNKKGAPLPRYCRTCEAFKPPRSHHCRICKRCVLKMDHHCPWINNCVGHFNYGHFVRFITWVTLTTGACMVLLVWRIVDIIQNEIQYMVSEPKLHWISLFSFSSCGLVVHAPPPLSVYSFSSSPVRGRQRRRSSLWL